MLVVTTVGNICDRDGRGSRISSGDVVFIPPGIQHWHGACHDSFMAHLAISLRGHQWLAPVSDIDYARALGWE